MAADLTGLPTLPAGRDFHVLAQEMADRHFPVSEWQAASSRQLTGDEVAWAWWWTTYVLGPARRVFGPLLVTSFERGVNPNTGATETGGHSTEDAGGYAVDFAPLADGVTTREVRDWLAAHKLEYLGELIDERDHVHMTVRGVGGFGEVWNEVTEGDFQPGQAMAALVAGLFAALLVGLLVLGGL